MCYMLKDAIFYYWALHGSVFLLSIRSLCFHGSSQVPPWKHSKQFIEFRHEHNAVETDMIFAGKQVCKGLWEVPVNLDLRTTNWLLLGSMLFSFSSRCFRAEPIWVDVVPLQFRTSESRVSWAICFWHFWSTYIIWGKNGGGHLPVPGDDRCLTTRIIKVCWVTLEGHLLRECVWHIWTVRTAAPVKEGRL